MSQDNFTVVKVDSNAFSPVGGFTVFSVGSTSGSCSPVDGSPVFSVDSTTFTLVGGFSVFNVDSTSFSPVRSTTIITSYCNIVIVTGKYLPG